MNQSSPVVVIKGMHVMRLCFLGLRSLQLNILSASLVVAKTYVLQTEAASEGVRLHVLYIYTSTYSTITQLICRLRSEKRSAFHAFLSLSSGVNMDVLEETKIIYAYNVENKASSVGQVSGRLPRKESLDCVKLMTVDLSVIFR